MIRIAPAATAAELDTMRALMREYQKQLGVDLGYQGFESELAALPGVYSPPPGRLLLATTDDDPVGCVAFRSAGEGRAEMKRLYVRSAARGLGVGRALVERVVAEARAAGYDELVLDTLPSMGAAHRLYRQLGFREIPPYAVRAVEGTRYLGFRLRAD